MKHYKIFVVAIVSAVVAILTTLIGVTGTIIGSVITSVGYNVLVEMFEEPPTITPKKRSFEWEIAYVFPLVIIAIVQFFMIFGFLSKLGFLPFVFYHIYLEVQTLTMFNLYRIMGIALIILACYPYILTPKAVNRTHGKYILIVGLIFLAKGITDISFLLGTILSIIFRYLDLPLAIITFVILLWVIVSIFNNKSDTNLEDLEDLELKEVYSPKQETYYYNKPSYQRKPYSQRKNKPRKINKPIAYKRKKSNRDKSFNSSSENIKFDSRNPYDDERRR